jgi:hypothetical protein
VVVLGLCTTPDRHNVVEVRPASADRRPTEIDPRSLSAAAIRGIAAGAQAGSSQRSAITASSYGSTPT